MFSYQAVQHQAEAWLLVLLTAVFALPALIAAVPAGRATDRWGGSRMALGGSLVCALGIAIALLLPGLAFLLVASAVVGLGNLMSMVGQQTFVAHASRGRPTEGAFGFLSATASAGQAVAPLLVTIVAALGSVNTNVPNTSPALTVCLVLCLLGVSVYKPMRTAERIWACGLPRSPATGRSAGRVPIAKVWPAIVVSGFVLVAMDLLYTFVPVWGLQHGVSTVAIGFLLSLRAIVSMASRIGLGRLVGRFGRRNLLAVSTALSCVAFACFPHVGFIGAAVLMLILGIGLGVPQPLTMSWSVALTEPVHHGAVLGLRLSANRLAQITVPLAVGALAAPFGSASVFYTKAALMAGACALSMVHATPDKDPPLPETKDP
jgi:MFS family permease